METFKTEEIIQSAITDNEIIGFYTKDGKTFLDRRYTSEATARRNLTTRTVDLNIIGPEVLEVDDELLKMLTNLTLTDVNVANLKQGEVY